MIRLAKKTRFRLFLIILIPILIIIVIFYSGVYTSNQIKFSNFIDSNNNNDNNYHFGKVSVNNDLPLSLNPKDTNNLFTHSNSIDNNYNEELVCNDLNSNQTFDINTIDDYQKLEFKPQYKTYWNYSFEKKYLEIKEKWKQLPLKVNIS
jgi:hypothetical protein